MTQITKLDDILHAAERNTGSKVALAKALNVNPTAVTYWFQGRNTPTLRHYLKLLKLAGKRAAMIVLSAIAAHAGLGNGNADASPELPQPACLSTENYRPDPTLKALAANTLHIMRIIVD